MRMGFTGTSQGMSDAQKARVAQILNWYQPDEADHGLCIGADAEFHGIVRNELPSRCKIFGHPPIIRRKMAIWLEDKCDFLFQPGDYHDRDRDIVDRTQMMVATVLMPEYRRSGTWTTIRYARKENKHTLIVMRDGTVLEEGKNT